MYNLKINKETFLILKELCIKKNDQIGALEFYKKEMDAYKNNIKWKSKELPNKLILYFEKVISNYGTNPFLSVGWLFILIIFISSNNFIISTLVFLVIDISFFTTEKL